MKHKSGKGVRNLETKRQLLSMVIRKGLTQKTAYEQMLESGRYFWRKPNTVMPM